MNFDSWLQDRDCVVCECGDIKDCDGMVLDFEELWNEYMHDEKIWENFKSNLRKEVK